MNNLKRIFSPGKILIVGDVILDQYLHYSEMPNTELDSQVVKLLSKKEMPGGAANVAKNVLNLGGEVILVGVVGNDQGGVALKNILEKKDVDSILIVDKDRKTTIKSRIIVNGRQLCRLDHEDNFRLSRKIEDRLMQQILKEIALVNGVIISDYLKGAITERIAKKIVAMSKRKGIKVFVDSKDKNLNKFNDCFLIKINRKEAEAINKTSLDTVQKIKEATISLMERHNCNVVITLDKDGLSYTSGNQIVINFTNNARTSIKSTIGAGDTMLAGIAMSLLSGFSFKESAFIGHMCGEISVRKLHTVSCDYRDLVTKFKSYEKSCFFR